MLRIETTEGIVEINAKIEDVVMDKDNGVICIGKMAIVNLDKFVIATAKEEDEENGV